MNGRPFDLCRGTAVAKRRKKRKSKLTPEQRKIRKIQRDHKKEIRAVFSSVGFERLPSLSEWEFSFQGTTSDIDDLFIYENVVAVVEYTTARESGISDHLKRKKVLYDKITRQPGVFVDFLTTGRAEFRRSRNTDYSTSQTRVVVVYCSVNSIKRTLKQELPELKYLDFQVVKYFKAVTSAIKQSAKYEFFSFLGLSYHEIGANVLSPTTAEHTEYAASLLPEEASHFRKGYKVVSFYVDPGALLSRCYVLRQDRWEEPSNLYQRMISKKKIEAVRKYLLDDKRVFINKYHCNFAWHYRSFGWRRARFGSVAGCQNRYSQN
jgi:hypothetical protein